MAGSGDAAQPVVESTSVTDRPLNPRALLRYLAEAKTMAQQLAKGGHRAAAQAARSLAAELDKELERVSPKR